MASEPLVPLVRYLRKVTRPTATGDIPDAELLSQFVRHGDEAAFAALVRRHGSMVLAVCRRVLRDGHAAEDAFQATFLVLARKAGSLARPELLGSWLHGVAQRTAAKAKTETARRRAHEQQAVRAPEIDPDDACDWQDVRGVLDEEVNRLPERYRVPVVLCYLQGQTNAEAARRLGCSRGTIATLLARARDKLRRRLTQRGVGLSVGVSLAALTEPVRSSAVSLALEHVTVKAAILLAAGQMQAAGALAAQAVALAKGVGKGMLMEKLKIPVAILMMTALAGVGVGVSAYRARAQQPQLKEADSEAKAQPPVKAERPRPHVTGSAAKAKDQEAKFRTKNFVVTAPTEEIAHQVGEAAEHNRKALALLWLGKELPPWPQPCPVRVTVTDKTTNSYSEFAFEDGKVSRGGMVLEGALDRIFADLLPHEMTHTLLAQQQGRPLPRWADEGAATLSESAASRADYEREMEKVLRSGRQTLPLRELLPSLDYPKELMTFYARSLSLTDFLVAAKGRRKFLAFVAEGQRDGWNKAVNSIYGYKSVAALEQAWLAHARKQLADKRDEEPSLPGEKIAGTKANRQRRGPNIKGELPASPAPVQGWVVLDEDDALTVVQKIFCMQPVTTERVLKDGRREKVTSYEARRFEQAAVHDLSTVRVHDTKGRTVDVKEVRKRLKSEMLALISADGQSVDPLHLRLYKEDTLVFVLPPQAPRTEPTLLPAVQVNERNFDVPLTPPRTAPRQTAPAAPPPVEKEPE
jgi:RNA polymerase sigma factor (sigma-70 family)